MLMFNVYSEKRQALEKLTRSGKVGGEPLNNLGFTDCSLIPHGLKSQ